MGLLDLGAKNVMSGFNPAVSAVPEIVKGTQEMTVPVSAGPKRVNPEAFQQLQLIMQQPDYTAVVTPENQKLLQDFVSSVGEDGFIHKYPKDYWRRGPVEFAQQKLMPFQGDQKFAPGEQSGWGDIFNRAGAGVRNVIRSEQKSPELSRQIKDAKDMHDAEYKSTPFFPGKPMQDKQGWRKKEAAIKDTYNKEKGIDPVDRMKTAWNEGFERPREVEDFRTEDTDKYWDTAFDPKEAGGKPKGYLGRALGGMAATTKGMAKDIFSNPADLALMAAPVPKALGRVGDIPIGKGFVKGVKNVFSPSVVGTKTGVAAGKEAISQGLKRPTAKGQVEFPFSKTTPTKAPANLVDDVGQQVFPFGKTSAKASKPQPQGQMELNFPTKAIKSQGQKAFPFVDDAAKAVTRDAKAAKIIEKTGGKFKGITSGEDSLYGMKEPTVWYNDPSGSTHTLKLSELSGKSVKAKFINPKADAAAKAAKKAADASKKNGKALDEVADFVSYHETSQLIKSDAGEYSRLAGGFPMELGGKGYKTKDLAAVIKKVKAGKKLTDRQQNIYDDMMSVHAQMNPEVPKKIKPKSKEITPEIMPSVKTPVKVKPLKIKETAALKKFKESTSTLKSKLKNRKGFADFADDEGKSSDDVVNAFREMLPEIIDDVKINGGTVMDRIKGLVDDAGKPLANDDVLRMVEHEVGKSAAAAKAEITHAGNWNVKAFDRKIQEAIVRMSENKPNITAKGNAVPDAEVSIIAGKMSETPTMQAIARLKPGKLAGELRKTTDDAAAAFKSVIENDVGPKGLMKKLQELAEKRMTITKDIQGKLGRTMRQGGVMADDEVAIKKLIQGVIDRYKKDPLLSPEDFATIEKDLIKLQNKFLNTTDIKTFFDKTYFVWLNSLLSNPFTHGVNFMSNAMFALEKFPNRTFDILGDYTVRGIARSRGVRLPAQYKWKELRAMYRGFKRFTKHKIKGNATPFKIMKGSKIDTHMPSPLSESVDNIVGRPVKFLKQGDDIFKEVNGYMEFYARHVAGERGKTLQGSIHEEQLVRTFQDQAGPLAEWLLSGKEKVPGIRWLIPFVKTPERLLMRGLERTPVGAGGKLIRGAIKGESQKQMAHNVGLLYESALMTAGVGWLWQNSMVVGDAPKDEAERAAFFESGKKPNSIKIAGHWIPFSRMEPLGTALSLMVNFTQDVANSDKEYTIDKIIDGIGGITQTLANKTYFSGVLGFMRAAAEPQIYGGKLLSKFVASGMPGIAKFAADLIDPVYRQADGALGEIGKRTPFLSKLVEPTLGVFGDEQKKTPLGIGKEKTDKLTLSLKDTPVPMPSRRLNGEKLTSKEYNSILTDAGPILKDTLTKIVSTPNWIKIPRGIRAMIVEDTTSKIRGSFRSILKMQKIQKEIQADPQAYVNKFLE